ncbi:MAG: hypothetical protein IKS48_06765 [Eubacterium sp.]|nr:hypothetical protein [Eubacterium sp.]
MEIKTVVKEYLLSEASAESKELLEKDENVDILGGNILDSLGIVKFLAFVEEQFDVDLVDSNIELDDFSSLSRLCNLIEQKIES